MAGPVSGNVTTRCTFGKVAEKHRYQEGPTRDAFKSLIYLFFGYDLIEKLPVYLMDKIRLNSDTLSMRVSWVLSKPKSNDTAIFRTSLFYYLGQGCLFIS